MSSGDWMCGACQHLNFKKRDACQRCQCPKFATPTEMSTYGLNRTEVLAGDWNCSTFNCGAHNYASRTVCYRCGALKDYTTAGMISASAGGCYTQDSNMLPGWKTGDWVVGCTIMHAGWNAISAKHQGNKVYNHHSLLISSYSCE
ncbi:hypothetical protein QVD17_23003 [Tagetes erecta]|uniref:RanBP2-type domain-containing protein n=1 Tax=Tagetes erecta TaxID=13708 RepID=A0AAD8KDK2_TARER|nr:hypothetical protein QVD17_23003 [Tagetes erecta]